MPFTSGEKRPRAKHQASNSTRAPIRQTHGDSSDSDSGDDNDCSSCDGNGDGNGDGDGGDIDMADQDEDVIRAAEAAQQVDLDEAEQLAELEITVTNSERKVASTALAKVSNHRLQMRISTDCAHSSLSLPTRSTTCQASLRRWKRYAKLPTSTYYA